MAFTPKKIGTGFTNINRIIAANKNNQLGQTVAGGVQGQVQNVKQGTQEAQKSFQEEADKTRLDTDAAKEQRSNVIGRFSQMSGYDPAAAKKAQEEQANLIKSQNLAQKNYEAEQAKLSGYQQNIDNSLQAMGGNAYDAAALNKRIADAEAVNRDFRKEAMAMNPYHYSGMGENSQANKYYDAWMTAAQDMNAAKADLAKLNQYNSYVSQLEAQQKAIEENKGIYDTYKQKVDANTAALADWEAKKAASQAVPITDQELSDFTKYREGVYTGPKELSSFSKLLGQAQEAETLGDLTRSSGGRQELLRRYVGGTGYTQGQQRLDNTILGQTAGDSINQARRGTQNLEQKTTQANQQAGNLAQEYSNRAKAFGEETKGQLESAYNPLSQALDARLSGYSSDDELRNQMFNTYGGLLTGTNAEFKNIDPMARLGIGLQDMFDRGYINNEQISQLLGDNGLISRAQALGLDTNALINERLSNTASQNLTRNSIATEEEASKMSALQRLMGKQGTDIEFNNPANQYQAGNIGLNVDSLRDYITKTEDERARSDKAYADKLAAERARYLNQGTAGLMGAVGGATDVGGAYLNQILTPEAYVNPTLGMQNIATGVQGVGNVGLGLAQAYAQYPNAVLEGLAKLNIGGTSIANTEGGKQLLKAIDLTSKAQNEGLKAGSTAVGNLSSGITDLSKGNIIPAYTKLMGLNTIGDIAKQVSASSIGSSVGGAVKSVGKKLKKVFSDERLKQNIKPADNEVENFMDDLSPHKYQYKDKVADKPGGGRGNRISVMAQELEKSKLGKKTVSNEKDGKMVDYDKMQPIQLAAIANLNKRLNKLEGKDE